MSDHYRLQGERHYPPDIADLAYRRVRPFLDMAGMQTRPLEHLMAEAYLQGIKDAAAAAQEKEKTHEPG